MKNSNRIHASSTGYVCSPPRGSPSNMLRPSSRRRSRRAIKRAILAFRRWLRGLGGSRDSRADPVPRQRNTISPNLPVDIFPACKECKTGDLINIRRATWWSSEAWDIYPHGYPIHDRCWSLIEHYIAPDPDLERLVIALRKHWYRGGYGSTSTSPWRTSGTPGSPPRSPPPARQ